MIDLTSAEEEATRERVAYRERHAAAEPIGVNICADVVDLSGCQSDEEGASQLPTLPQHWDWNYIAEQRAAYTAFQSLNSQPPPAPASAAQPKPSVQQKRKGNAKRTAANAPKGAKPQTVSVTRPRPSQGRYSHEGMMRNIGDAKLPAQTTPNVVRPRPLQGSFSHEGMMRGTGNAKRSMQNETRTGNATRPRPVQGGYSHEGMMRGGRSAERLAQARAPNATRPRPLQGSFSHEGMMRNTGNTNRSMQNDPRTANGTSLRTTQRSYSHEGMMRGGRSAERSIQYNAVNATRPWPQQGCYRREGMMQYTANAGRPAHPQMANTTRSMPLPGKDSREGMIDRSGNVKRPAPGPPNTGMPHMAGEAGSKSSKRNKRRKRNKANGKHPRSTLSSEEPSGTASNANPARLNGDESHERDPNNREGGKRPAPALPNEDSSPRKRKKRRKSKKDCVANTKATNSVNHEAVGAVDNAKTNVTMSTSGHDQLMQEKNEALRIPQGAPLVSDQDDQREKTHDLSNVQPDICKEAKASARCTKPESKGAIAELQPVSVPSQAENSPACFAETEKDESHALRVTSVSDVSDGAVKSSRQSQSNDGTLPREQSPASPPIMRDQACGFVPSVQAETVREARAKNQPTGSDGCVTLEDMSSNGDDKDTRNGSGNSKVTMTRVDTPGSKDQDAPSSDSRTDFAVTTNKRSHSSARGLAEDQTRDDGDVEKKAKSTNTKSSKNRPEQRDDEGNLGALPSRGSVLPGSDNVESPLVFGKKTQSGAFAASNKTENCLVSGNREIHVASNGSANPSAKEKKPTPTGFQNESWQSTVIIIDSSDDDSSQMDHARKVKDGKRPAAAAAGLKPDRSTQPRRRSQQRLWEAASNQTKTRQPAAAASYGTAPRKRAPRSTPLPGAQYNYTFSESEALKEQERLFREAAERVRREVALNRARVSQPAVHLVDPTITDISKLNQNHWRAHDPYARLGLPHGVSIAVIKSRYRRLALAYHPDKSDSADTTARFQAVTEAYKLLTGMMS